MRCNPEKLHSYSYAAIDPVPAMSRIPALLLLVLPLLGGMVFSGEYYYEVPYEGEESLHAELKLALGRVFVEKAEPDYLFQAEVRLEKDGLTPHFSYEREDNVGYVRLGLDGSKEEDSFQLHHLSDLRASEWRIYLGDRVPNDVRMKLAMAEGHLDFSGIALRSLDIECGVTRSRLRFSEPNPVPMRVLNIDAGASEFIAEGLGFSRAAYISFNGGMGSFSLDLTGGAFPEGAEVDISMGMGKLTVTLPREEAVVLELPSSWLLKTDIPVGYTKKGPGLWYNEYVRDPEAALRVRIKASMGVVQLRVR